MSVEVVKVQTDEYRITVKKDDPELTREYAVAAELSAIASELSAVASAGSAAESLASENASGLSATAAEGFATASEAASITSTEQAVLSATARNDAEAAKLAAQNSEDVSTEQAAIATTKATESAESAADAEAAKNLILNKAEVNVTTAGNILLADGTLFKSISKVEFLRNKDAFARSFAGTGINIDKLVYWDNFIRPNSSSLGIADSGQAYQTLNGAGWAITENELTSVTDSISAVPLTTSLGSAYISRTLMRISPPNFNTRSGIGFFIDKDNFISLTSTRNECIIVKKTMGVDSIIASISYSINGNSGISFVNSQIDFTFRIYSNSARTLVFLQSDFLNISEAYNLNDTSYFNQINFYGYVSNNQNFGNIISSILVKDI